jgi:DNA-binding SARP family transcriptional activator
MYRLTLLGSIDLRDEHGSELRGVLAQPKRLALLACLAMQSPGGAVRRDHLLGFFWPELPQERARKALNKAVHFLRQELGDEVIVSRNIEELAVNDRLWCDAVAFADLLKNGKAGDALELYGGDLLPSFYLTGAEAFESWLEQERSRLRRLAARAAHELADERERRNQATTAVHFARRAVDLAEDDERMVRQLLELLDRLGDRAGALYAYDKFARRLAIEFEASPAIETQQLVERIRARADAHASPITGTTVAVATAAPSPVFEPPDSAGCGFPP